MKELKNMRALKRAMQKVIKDEESFKTALKKAERVVAKLQKEGKHFIDTDEHNIQLSDIWIDIKTRIEELGVN